MQLGNRGTRGVEEEIRREGSECRGRGKERKEGTIVGEEERRVTYKRDEEEGRKRVKEGRSERDGDRCSKRRGKQRGGEKTLAIRVNGVRHTPHAIIME